MLGFFHIEPLTWFVLFLYLEYYVPSKPSFLPVYLVLSKIIVPWKTSPCLDSGYFLPWYLLKILLRLWLWFLLLLLFLIFSDLLFHTFLHFWDVICQNIFIFNIFWLRFPFFLSCVQCLPLSVTYVVLCWWSLPLRFLFKFFS